MAKLRGPLMSIDARGKFADAIVFGGWKGIPWARVQFIPQNPQTDLQQALRLIFTEGVTRWQQLTPTIQGHWQVAVENKGVTMSGFNFFMSEYITSMRAGQVPSDNPPANLYP